MNTDYLNNLIEDNIIKEESPITSNKGQESTITSVEEPYIRKNKKKVKRTPIIFNETPDFTDTLIDAIIVGIILLLINSQLFIKLLDKLFANIVIIDGVDVIERKISIKGNIIQFCTGIGAFLSYKLLF